jgi:serine/threonine protein phosphatase PrpC
MYRYSFFCSQGIRENNQDACYVDKKENGQLFAIVCDGVGSEKHSEVASQTTITTFADAFLSTTDIKFLPFVQTNAKKSYDDIVKTMDELYPNKPSSTTMICCLVENKRANIA